jgi:hypothetical protein
VVSLGKDDTAHSRYLFAAESEAYIFPARCVRLTGATFEARKIRMMEGTKAALRIANKLLNPELVSFLHSSQHRRRIGRRDVAHSHIPLTEPRLEGAARNLRSADPLNRLQRIHITINWFRSSHFAKRRENFPPSANFPGFSRLKISARESVEL